MRAHPLIILALLATLSVPTPTAAQPPDVLLRTPGSSATVHRGDWAPFDLLLVGYAAEWVPTLEALLAALDATADVVLLVGPADDVEIVGEWLQHLSLRARVEPIAFPLDTPWVRDYGPLQVLTVDGDARWLDAAYGAARPADDAFPGLLADVVGAQIEVLPLRLDGGALIANGRGLCVTTADHLAPPEADAGARDALLDRLGCAALAIVPPLSEDPTAHVDMFAQFVDAETLILAEADPHALPDDALRLDVAASAVERAAAALGAPLRIVRVPLHRHDDGTYATYANGLTLPDAYLMPTSAATPRAVDLAAAAARRRAIPERRVVTIRADAVIRLGGALHCTTLGLGLPKVGP